MIATRRRFLVGGLEVAAYAAVCTRASPALDWTRSSEEDERILVVLQLTGANDGLNTLVPHRQDGYHRNRPALGLAPKLLHKIDDDHGLHPAMEGMARLHAEGQLALVHGVGYPHPDRSHFRSMEIWHTADPEHPPGGTGWLGRLADQVAQRHPGAMASLHVGSESLPLALYGQRYFAPSVRDPHGFRLETLNSPYAKARGALLVPTGAGELAFLRDAAQSTYKAAEKMQAMAEARAGVEYPQHELGQRLRLVARLITGGFGTRVFHLAHSGYDTHARQAPAHAALLGELSGALSAFQKDLRAHAAHTRVVTLVFSEFGRRVAENASKGTDHGAAAPVFLVGGAVRGGPHGTPPDLGKLEEGDVPFTTDFRSIYATLEHDWLGLKPSTGFKSLPLLAV